MSFSYALRVPRLRLVWFACCLLLGLTALALGARRVVELERTELEERTESRTLSAWASAEGATQVSARLISVALKRDEQASFEVCSDATPPNEVLKDALTFVVWRPDVQKLELSVPLNDKYLAMLKRSGTSACLVLGGGFIEHDGRYALDAVWGRGGIPKGLEPLRLRARVLAKHPLERREGLLVACVALSAIGAALALYVPRPRAPSPTPSRTLQVVAGAALATALGFVALLFSPLLGASGGLLRGALISLLEVAIASAAAYLLFARVPSPGGSPRAAFLRGLGLCAPEARGAPLLLVAPLLAALLHPLARLAMSVVPSTGEAPLEAFIAWPSGALCFALVGMFAPCAEELFFRGLVYGSLRTVSAPLAFVTSTLLFAVAHAQQSFGNWGALLAVTLTGLAMTTLRAVSGSTLLPMAAHVLYNLSLWRSSFGG